MSTINRQYRFSDGTKFYQSHLDAELDNFANTFNNLNLGTLIITNVILKAPDGRKFLLNVGYQPDGVTPVLQLTESL